MSFIVMLGCFMIIWGIVKLQGHYIEETYEKLKKGNVDKDGLNAA